MPEIVPEDFTAELKISSGEPAQLMVNGKIVVNTRGWQATMLPIAVQTEPNTIALRVETTPPSGYVAQVITTIPLSYSEVPAKSEYKRVIISYEQNEFGVDVKESRMTTDPQEMAAALDRLIAQQNDIAIAVKERLLRLAVADADVQRAMLTEDINRSTELGLIEQGAAETMIDLVRSSRFSMEGQSLAPALAQAVPQFYASGTTRPMAEGENLGNWPAAGVIVGAMAGGLMGGIPGAGIGAAVGGAGGSIIGRMMRHLR